jgi:NAD(P)H-flavin reductase
MIIKPTEYHTKVVTKELISPKVIFLQLDNTPPVVFTAGQYASFLIDNKRRLYSFASLPTDKKLDFLVDISPHGVGSNYVEQLHLGQGVRFLAPYGRFILDENDERPVVFVATGTGIAPIRGQLKQELLRSVDRPLTLIFGNYNEQHLFFRDELEALARKNPRLTFLPIFSDPPASWSGVTGFVTHYLTDKMTNHADYTWYICGNPDMVKDVIKILDEHQVPKEQIHFEQFL